MRPAQRSLYPALIFRNISADGSYIFLADCSVLKLLHQACLNFFILCHDHYAGGVFVKPVHKVRNKLAFKMAGQRVYKRAFGMPAGGMNHKPRPFVDYNDVFIFVNYLKRNIFRLNFIFFVYYYNFNLIAFLEPAGRGCFLRIDQHMSHIYQALKITARVFL